MIPEEVTEWTDHRGRRYAIWRDHQTGQKHITTYARYLMAWWLGRWLTQDEEVHHTDLNFANDELINLEVITVTQHRELHVQHRGGSLVYLQCALCGNYFYRLRSELVKGEKKGNSGPFCGNSCSMSYKLAVRYGKIEPFQPFRVSELV